MSETGDFVCTKNFSRTCWRGVPNSLERGFTLRVIRIQNSTLVWSVRLKKLELDLPGHSDEIFACDWSPLGTKGASGGKIKC